MENKIIRGLPFERYKAIDALSQSTLKHIVRSPGHLKHYLKHGIKLTPEIIFGGAADCLVFDGIEEFERRYAIRPEGLDLRTVAGRAWLAANEGRTPVPATVLSCVDALRASPLASRYLEGGESQLSVVWEHAADLDNGSEARVWLKGRPDHYHAGSAGICPVVVDLKTTDDASPDAFARKAYNLKYHWQAAIYLDGLAAVTGEPHEDFSIVAVERDPPHRVEVYDLPASIIEQGRAEYLDALKLYVQCRDANHWPTSIGKVLTLEFPAWATR